MKKKTKAEKEHLNRVAEIGCIACRKLGFYDTPAQIHHIRDGKGIGQRASHFETIPLCPTHHQHGKDAIHVSKATFERKFGTERHLLNEVKLLLCD